MIHFIQNRFALSRDGAISFVKAVVWSLLLNLALMLPAKHEEMIARTSNTAEKAIPIQS